MNEEAESITSWRSQAAQIARSIVAGEVGLLEGARDLAGIGPMLVHDTSADPDFSVLVGVASETDDMPFGGARALWNPAALAEKDRELSDYECRVRDVVPEACQSIWRRYVSNREDR
jgi:hypothetical protein